MTVATADPSFSWLETVFSLTRDSIRVLSISFTRICTYLPFFAQIRNFPSGLGFNRLDASEAIFYILAGKMTKVSKAMTILTDLRDV